MKIIAEIGLNHCGSIQRANNLVKFLTKSSVDAISFQVRENEFYDQTHPRKFQLPLSFYNSALNISHKNQKEFCIAIAEPDLISDFNDMGVDSWKTLSWDIKNKKLHNNLQKTKKTTYISTGVSSLEEIISVSSVYKNIVFIHTQLNDSIKNANLKAINTIRSTTKIPTAFGLHCTNHLLLYSAVSFEPESIFFYVKDETDGEHPDDKHAVSLNSIEKVVSNLRELAKGIGEGEKKSIENTMHPDDDDIMIKNNL